MLFLLSFSSDSDREKFEYLYDRYKSLLLHKAYGILKDHMLAEDAVSEAYLRIYKNLDKIDDPASNRSIAFAVTIVKNTALTILSRETKKQTELIDDIQEDGFDLEGHILSQLTTQGIYDLVNALGEEFKNVFVLKYAYDMSHRQIGETLGISENNVTVRLHRAKKKLSAMLVKEGYVHE